MHPSQRRPRRWQQGSATEGDPEPRAHYDPHGPMSDERFWSLIAKVDVEALEAGDEEAALSALESALATLPTEQLEAFEEVLAAKLFDIDGRRYAEAAGESGTSDDAFLYARCFVVARGAEHYARVCANPALMPNTLEQWCEGLLSLASTAFENQTGTEWNFVPRFNYETGSNRRLWTTTDSPGE